MITAENGPANEDLGPFQPLWDAWEESHREITEKPLSHFRRVLEIQFDEMEAHLASDNRKGAEYEVIDLISVALNLMRWLGNDPASIGELARSRAENRMRNRTAAILDKYQSRYGV
ncbi:hypothetical protein I6A84_41000 [Frankia sp. CNm7]|uniref:Uncharacterized protein n=1 Tax=Frankia nepalensis TaxID=1836974 RepID=A0A937RW34_9ACTN|nr:hypothetical protein [Frankia nepalensis]MBL7498889.1 hypothetical protein [Frankia nepalensis]MBL7512564.1 hypothetical protein [Frankia nepalensis]MBL7524252.1 hypothetical protein [Frankia nepalensis]MBL7632921.1 hypothetical protein [Frankia nepalensis]